MFGAAAAWREVLYFLGQFKCAATAACWHIWCVGLLPRISDARSCSRGTQASDRRLAQTVDRGSNTVCGSSEVLLPRPRRKLDGFGQGAGPSHASRGSGTGVRHQYVRARREESTEARRHFSTRAHRKRHYNAKMFLHERLLPHFDVSVENVSAPGCAPTGESLCDSRQQDATCQVFVGKRRGIVKA